MRAFMPTQEEYLKEILKDLDKQGFDTSQNSNIYKILKEVAKYNYIPIKESQQLIKDHSFDDKTGEELDKLYNFFGIPRKIKTENKYSTLNFKNQSNYIIQIKVGTTIKKGESFYKTATTQSIPTDEVAEIFLNKIENGIFVSKNLITINEFELDLNGIELIENIDDNTRSELAKCIFFNLNDNYEKESDIEYMSRAKNLIQYYGDGNINKIKNYIKGIENVSDVIISSALNETKIIIIPTDVYYLDKIIEQAKEAVDYFKSSHVVLCKPSITEFSITNFTTQIQKEYAVELNNIIKGVVMYLEEFFKKIYYEEVKEIDSEKIYFYINKFLIDNGYEISISEKELEISYRVYAGDDYTTPIVINKLDYRQKKKISSDIVVIKGVD